MRVQSGIFLDAQSRARIRLSSIKDLPMNAMSVGQLSVMVPGLANQLIRDDHLPSLETVVGFGPMFWTLAWHGKTPREMQEHVRDETLMGNNSSSEQDLMIVYLADQKKNIDRLDSEINSPLSELTESSRVSSGEVVHHSESPNDRLILIPPSEADFCGGCFAWLFEFVGDDLPDDSLQNLLAEMSTEDSPFTFHIIENVEDEPHRKMVLIYYRLKKTIDALCEKIVSVSKGANSDTRLFSSGFFFVPSIDVLTGLRQGGIRMNRFSTTKQWS